jgi:hypothetical protein
LHFWQNAFAELGFNELTKGIIGYNLLVLYLIGFPQIPHVLGFLQAAKLADE